MTTPPKDTWIDQAKDASRRQIQDVESQIERIESLRGRGDEVAAVFAAAKDVWKYDSDAVRWLIEDNMVLAFGNIVERVARVAVDPEFGFRKAIRIKAVHEEGS